MDARVGEAIDDGEPDADELGELITRVKRGINGQAFRVFGNHVHTGPFTGMIIPSHTSHWDDGNSGCKLMGCYEHELHPAIEHAVWRRPKVVVNVGCSEGYYAVGMARLLRERANAIYALDVNDDALLMCQDYAVQNGVQVKVINGVRAVEELRFSGVWGHRLYIMDVEGDELNLIDLGRCPELAYSDLIVECHDFMAPACSSILADRLTETHRVELIHPRLPNFNDFVFLKQFPTMLSALMVLEKRPMPTYWLACWAIKKGLSDG